MLLGKPRRSWADMGRYAKEAQRRIPLEGRQPTDSDFSYFAGLFDGEGSIDVLNGATPRLKISMTDGPTIAWLEETFGGRVYVEKPSGTARKVAWKWQLIPRVDVEYVMRNALPYLKTKMDRANACIAVLDFSAHATSASYKNYGWLAERDALLQRVKAGSWEQRHYVSKADSTET